MTESLTERERTCLTHLEQAQNLGVSVSEYALGDRHVLR